MITNFRQIVDDVLADCKSPTDPQMRERVKRWVNYRLMQYMTEIETPQQWDDFFFDTVVGQREYPMPGDINGWRNVRVVGKAKTFTITIANPGVISCAAHGLSTGDAVYAYTNGTLPTGMTAGTTYYFIKVDAGSGKFAASYALAVAGTAIETTGTQTGAHQLAGAWDRRQTWVLDPVPDSQWDQDNPANYTETPASPAEFRFKQMMGVKAKYEGTGAVSAVSDSAIDVNTQCSVQGYLDAARSRNVNSTVNLTASTSTPVAFPQTPFLVIMCSKGQTVGSVTFYKSVNGTNQTLAVLGPMQNAAEHCIVELADTPDAIYRVALKHKRLPPPMVNDTDVPLYFPRAFLNVLADGAKVEGRDWIRDDRLPQIEKRETEGRARLYTTYQVYETEEAGVIMDYE